MPYSATPALPALPSLVTRGHALYYLDRSGTRWTVFDCRAVGTRLVVVGTASNAAGFRVFSGFGGARRLYEFAEAESREVDALGMERQMAASRALPAHERDFGS